jgi:hypothetical protein
VRLDDDMRIEGGELALRRRHLGGVDVGGGEQHLALQVGQRDRVRVDEADGPDPGGGQIEGGGRSEAAGPDDQHPGGGQGLLPRAADLAQHQVAGVALDLVRRKRHAP